MASRPYAADSTKKQLPGYAKTIILLQGLIIALLSLWVYEEYLNNQYFQVYVNNAFRTNGEAYVLLPTFILTILAVVAYAKIRVANGKSEAARVGSHGGDLGKREVAPETILGASPNAFPPAPIATPALAGAATRVLKRIAIGEGFAEKPYGKRTMPVLEKVEPRGNLEPKKQIETLRSFPRETELRQGYVDNSLVETQPAFRSAAEQGNLPTSTKPLVKAAPASGHIEPRFASKGPTFVERFNPFKHTEPAMGPSGRPLSQSKAGSMTGFEHSRGPRDNFSPERFQPFANPTGPRHGQEQGGVPRSTPPPAKQVKIGRGPLDNPLPENSLVPVLTRLPREPKQQEHAEVLTSRPFPQNMPLIPRRAEKPPGIGETSAPKIPLTFPRTRGFDSGSQYKQLPEKTLHAKPAEQALYETSKLASPKPTPPESRGVPTKEETIIFEKRPLIPESLGLHQGALGKLPARKLETVFQHLHPGTNPVDKLSTQTASSSRQGGETSPETSIAEKDSTALKQEEPGQTQVSKRPNLISRLGLNRVEPLPGAADNAWARKLPRSQAPDESGSNPEGRPPSKRSLVRRRIGPRLEQEDEDSDQQSA